MNQLTDNTVRESQIGGELNRYETHLVVLDETVGELSGRLTHVSEPEFPLSGEDKAKEPALVPMAERLRKFNETLESSNKRIMDIIKRLEI